MSVKVLSVALASAVIALAGCSASSAAGRSGAADSGNGAHGQPSIAAMSSPATEAQLTLPLDSYELSAEQSAQVERATVIYLRDCMNSFGFTLPVPEMRIPRYPKNAVILGWLGSQQVDRYGYHGPPGLNEEMAAASRRGRWPVVVPPDQVPVFEGTVRNSAGRPVPEGGCIGELRRRLTAGASADATANDEKVVPERGIEWYQSQANSLARSDSRFRAMVQAWSACMKRSGFRYKDTDQAAADRRWNAPGGDGSGEQVNISRTEIKTATTDLGCRNEVNYSGILQGLISAYEERIINEKSETLRSISSLLDVRLRNAAKILGEHPAS